LSTTGSNRTIVCGVVKGCSKIAQRPYNRIFFLCLRSLLGFILLSEISIKSTYHDILTFGLQTAGLTPINATLAEDDITRLVFWYNLPNFIPNSKYVVPIDPISCSGSGCNAYFAPGGLEDILLENYTNPEIPLEYYPEADSYLQKDAPGYQIEFDSSVAGLELSVDDCRVYGTQDLAIAVCIKSDKDSIVMGSLKSFSNG